MLLNVDSLYAAYNMADIQTVVCSLVGQSYVLFYAGVHIPMQNVITPVFWLFGYIPVYSETADMQPLTSFYVTVLQNSTGYHNYQLFTLTLISTMNFLTVK